MQTRNIALAATRLALALSLTLPGAVAWSADADTADHTAHHPAGAASTPKPAPAPVQKTTAKPGVAKAMQAPVDKGAMEKMDQMDTRMKAMQDMHQKLMAAKTAEERNALMPEQMKIMQEAMAAMEGMRGGKGGMGMMGGMEKGQMMDKMPPDMMMHQMMEKRMDMMQSMMQMMMDRMAPPAAQ